MAATVSIAADYAGSGAAVVSLERRPSSWQRSPQHGCPPRRPSRRWETRLLDGTASRSGAVRRLGGAVSAGAHRCGVVAGAWRSFGLLLVASTAAGLPPRSADLFPDDPRREKVACGNLHLLHPAFSDTELLTCDPELTLERSLARAEPRVASSALRAFDVEFGEELSGDFGVRGGVAIVTRTEEPLAEFAEAVATRWGLNSSRSFLLALRSGDRPRAALVGPFLKADWADLAPKGWLEVGLRRVEKMLRQRLIGSAVSEALEAIADAYAGSPGLGLPDLGGNPYMFFGHRPEERVIDEFESMYQRGEILGDVCAEKLCKELQLDELIQLTSRWEGYYHEAMAIPALNILGNRPGRPPRRVLIIGGGDAGVAGECLKFDTVERVVLLDIDPSVSNIARAHFPKTSYGFADPRFQAKVVDAFAWVRRRADRAKAMGGYFDLAVIDFTDSPIETFWSVVFFQQLSDLLVPDGILVHNVGYIGGPEGFRNSLRLHSQVFAQTFVMNTVIPDYEGVYFLGLSSKSSTVDPREGNWSYWARQNIVAQYYTVDLHLELFYVFREAQLAIHAPTSYSPGQLESAHFPRIVGDGRAAEWPTDPFEHPQENLFCSPVEKQCSIASWPGQQVNFYAMYMQDILVHLALNLAGRRARTVLILGGVPMYMLHVVLEHSFVEHVVVIEESKHRIEWVKRAYGEFKRDMQDSRAKLIVDDAIEVLPHLNETFDIILSTLEYMPWLKPSRNTRIPRNLAFGQQLKKLLNPQGILIHEAGTSMLPRHTQRTVDMLRSVFRDGSVHPFHAPSNTNKTEYRDPHYFVAASPTAFHPHDVDWSLWEQVGQNAKYYTASVHAWLFVLPLEVQRLLDAPPPEPRAGEDEGAARAKGLLRPPWERFEPFEEEKRLEEEASVARGLPLPPGPGPHSLARQRAVQAELAEFVAQARRQALS